jgi:hypothetical protein
MVRLSCPSCNTSFNVPEVPIERRAPCPRCGDVFPIRSWEEVSAIDALTRSSNLPSATRRDRARWSVQRTVGVALTMGLVGLIAGLVIYYTRSGIRPDATPGPGASISVVPASDLIGLGYLPADASLAFAVQPGPVLAYAARLKQEPRDLLIKAGLPPQVLDILAKLGLSLEQIDHITGAVNVDGPRLALVLVLRSPLDDEKLLKQLRATRSNGAKERYTIDAGGLPLTLARVSPTVWVFGFDSKKDLEAVERDGYGPGGKQLSPGLSEMIARVPPDAAAWIAADVDHWAEKPLVRMVFGEVLKKPEWLTALGRARALVAAISLNDPPRLRLFVGAADSSAGDRLRAYFLARATATEGATTGGAGELAFIETPIDPTTTFATLREMLNEGVKP